MRKRALLLAGLTATALATTAMTSTVASAEVADAPVTVQACGFYKSGAYAWYNNCSPFGAGVRVFWYNGSQSHVCVPGHYAKILGAAHQVNNAYTVYSC